MAEASGASVTTRAKEERETAKSRLQDHSFNMKNYADPLSPRDRSKALPPGITPEMEQRWLRMIEESRQK
ncbi:hypothetical protein BGZ63DRAFT_420646 [Mariannaea sp. PMI_226]|nr:hypothetical protein BGZ63DRAFT_420646 [Mariannaea sp. PMI_226]